MRWVPVESSSISSVGYKEGVLEICFRNGGVYRYFGVPEGVHAALMQADSKGRFFNEEIRGSYRWERVRQSRPRSVG